MSKYIPNSYQTPNILIDVHLRRDLDSYSFTILSVIIRKTIGFRSHEPVAISAEMFSEMIPSMGIATIKRRLKKLEGLGLISVVRSTVGKRGKAKSKYTLSDLFFDPDSSLKIAESREEGSDHSDTRVGITVIQGSDHSDTNLLNHIKHTLKTQQQQQAAVVIASLQKRRLSPAESRQLITDYGVEKCALGLEQLMWIEKNCPTYIKSSKVGFLRGTIKTDGGYEMPPGYQRSDVRLNQIGEVKAESEKQLAVQQAEETAAAEIAVRYDKFWEGLADGTRDMLTQNIVAKLAQENSFMHGKYQEQIRKGKSLDEMPVGVRAAFCDVRNEMLKIEIVAN